MKKKVGKLAFDKDKKMGSDYKEQSNSRHSQVDATWDFRVTWFLIFAYPPQSFFSSYIVYQGFFLLG